MSDEYIKMVLALDEKFFKEWEWKEGDMFLYKEDESETYSIGYIGTHILSNTKPVGFMDICFDPFEHLMNLRPIPSPEQLLKMCECEDEIYFESLALLHFANWLEDKVTKRNDFCLKYISAKEMMLLWVMETRYNKMWNGESWEKMV